MDRTTRHTTSDGATFALADISRIAREQGASAAFPYLRDVLIYGPTANVLRTLIALDLVRDRPHPEAQVGKVRDYAGRSWGDISGSGGRASARLHYLLRAG